MGQYLMFACLLVSVQQVMAQSPMRITPDSVKVTNAEVVVRNTTKDVAGYLYNNGNGNTIFNATGKAIQFTVGNDGFPASGDSVYTNGVLAGRNVKVWRYGLLQPANSSNGVSIDTLTGKIIFRPALTPKERIYIEALNSVDLSL